MGPYNGFDDSDDAFRPIPSIDDVALWPTYFSTIGSYAYRVTPYELPKRVVHPVFLYTESRREGTML